MGIKHLPILSLILVCSLVKPVAADSFIDAVKRADHQAVRKLLEKDPSLVTKREKMGYTPLGSKRVSGVKPVMARDRNIWIRM